VSNRAALVSAGGLRVNGQAYIASQAVPPAPATVPVPVLDATLKKE
jgi:hypothetical protein